MIDRRYNIQAKLISDNMGTLVLYTHLDTWKTASTHTPIDIRMVSAVAESAGFEIEDIDNQILR
jgi:hypothetical protein